MKQTKLLFKLVFLIILSISCVAEKDIKKKIKLTEPIPTPTDSSIANNNSGINNSQNNFLLTEFGNLKIQDDVISSNLETPIISWNPIPDVSYYKIGIGRSPLADDIVRYVSTGLDLTKKFENLYYLQHGQKYYANVKAYGINNQLLAQKSSDGWVYYDQHNLKFSPNFSNEVSNIDITNNNDFIFSGMFGKTSATFSPFIDIIDANTGLSTNEFVQTFGFNQMPTGVKYHKGKIYAWGELTHYNLIPVNKIVRINPNGEIDPSFNISLYFTLMPEYKILDLNFDTEDNLLITTELNHNKYLDKISKDGLDIISGDGIPFQIIKSGMVKNTNHFFWQFFNGDYKNQVIEIMSFKPNFEFTDYIQFISSKDYVLPICTSVKIGVITCFRPYKDAQISYKTTSSQLITMPEIVEFIIDTEGITAMNVDLNPFSEQSISYFNIMEIKEIDNEKVLLSGSYLKNKMKDFLIYNSSDQTILLNETFYQNIISSGHYDRIDFNNIKQLDASSEKLIFNIDINGTFQPFKINSNGQIDTLFMNMEHSYQNIRFIQEIPGNKLLTFGDFYTKKGNVNKKFLLANNSFGENYSIRSNYLNGDVTNIIEGSNGDLTLAGHFSKYKNFATGNIIRVKKTGELDILFNTDGGLNGEITKVFKLENDNIIVTGDFSQYKGQSVNKIIRLDRYGNLVNDFNLNLPNFRNISFITELSNSKLIVGYEDRISLRYSSGAKDLSFNEIIVAEGLSSQFKIHQMSDDIFLATNGSSFIHSTEKNHIIKFNKFGIIDNAFNCDPSINGSPVISRKIPNSNSLLLSTVYSPFNIHIIDQNCNPNMNLKIPTLNHKGYTETINMNSDGEIILGGNFFDPTNKIYGVNVLFLGF